MKSYEEKTVEELRKMASKKKIEGRSKMNKAALVRALKKSSKSKKMKGGEITRQQFDELQSRNLKLNPIYYFEDQDFNPTRSRQNLHGWIYEIKPDPITPYNRIPSYTITYGNERKRVNISLDDNITLVHEEGYDFDYLIRNLESFKLKGLSMPNPLPNEIRP